MNPDNQQIPGTSAMSGRVRTLLGCGTLATGIVAIVGSLMFAANAMNRQGDFAKQLKSLYAIPGTWYTSVPLNEAIRRELSGNASAKGEDAARTRREINAYREDFLERNPGVRAILEKQGAGKPIPYSVEVDYVELDNQPGFGT